MLTKANELRGGIAVNLAPERKSRLHGRFEEPGLDALTLASGGGQLDVAELADATPCLGPPLASQY
eukprot:498566-Pyramimonas_sp.AAC.2